MTDVKELEALLVKLLIDASRKQAEIVAAVDVVLAALPSFKDESAGGPPDEAGVSATGLRLRVGDVRAARAAIDAVRP